MLHGEMAPSRRAAGRIWIGALATIGVLGTALLATSSASAAVPCTVLADSLTATANDPGQTIAAWEDSCFDDELLFYYANTRVVIGSVSQGFRDLGAITPPTDLSSPTGVALDNAGNAWVSGVDRTFTEYREKQAGARYDTHGGWVAFRPADGHFGAPVALPGGRRVDSAAIAGNPSGDVLVTWRARASVYLAWTTPAGGIAKPQRLPGRLTVLGMGVDRRGRALVVLSRGVAALDETTSEVLTTTGALGRKFSHPRAVLKGRRDRHRHLTEDFDDPAVAMDSTGGALLAWTTVWSRDDGEESTRPERSFLARVSAAGRLQRRHPSPLSFLPSYISLATDPFGGVLFVGESDRLFALAPDGRVRARLGWPESSLQTHVAANPAGKVAIGGSSLKHGEAIGMLATATAPPEPPLHFATRKDRFSAVTTTIDAAGTGTLFWSDVSPQGIPFIYAHAIAPGGPPIEAGVGQPAASKPQL